MEEKIESFDQKKKFMRRVSRNIINEPLPYSSIYLISYSSSFQLRACSPTNKNRLIQLSMNLSSFYSIYYDIIATYSGLIKILGNRNLEGRR